MKGDFRQSMAWLHTWTGLVLGVVLFAVFWTGTLVVFEHEIDRWMMPDTRGVNPAGIGHLDGAMPVINELAGESPSWFLRMPTEREPAALLSYQGSDGKRRQRHLDLAGGRVLPDQGTKAATDFLFPLHYKLNLDWLNLGVWLVGLVGMAAVVMAVSGIVIHRGLFKELFTFRAHKRLPRASLDLHTVASVIGLPFHILMPLSGVIVMAFIFFPQAVDLVYADADNPSAEFREEARGGLAREPAGEPGGLGSVDAMLARARTLWGGTGPAYLSLRHPGDANAYLKMFRAYPDQVALGRGRLFFDASSGELLERFSAGPVMTVQRFLVGMHLIRFDHWPLRWLYFIGGAMGCVMVGTGFIYWLASRRKRHRQQGVPGMRLVEGLAVGAVTGIIVATLVFFVVNRLLPLETSLAGQSRAELEVWSFFLAWIAAFAHAWLRPDHAWREQCWAIAGLAVGAVALNAATTGDHLIRTIAEGYWPVAGMDLMLLATAGIAARTATVLGRRSTTSVASAGEAEVVAG